MMTYVFDVAPQKVYYTGATGFESHVFGAGAMTLEECEAQARKFARGHHATNLRMGLAAIYTGWFKVEIRKPCQTCKVTGVKPGCKRKKCEACEGRGSIEIQTFVFDAA